MIVYELIYGERNNIQETKHEIWDQQSLSFFSNIYVISSKPSSYEENS